MLGSFPPGSTVHNVIFPRNGWDEAPSGLLGRGDYKGKHQFIDDDGKVHLEYEYSFSVRKDWASTSDDWVSERERESVCVFKNKDVRSTKE